MTLHLFQLGQVVTTFSTERGPPGKHTMDFKSLSTICYLLSQQQRKVHLYGTEMYSPLLRREFITIYYLFKFSTTKKSSLVENNNAFSFFSYKKGSHHSLNSCCKAFDIEKLHSTLSFMEHAFVYA
ncbi:hypothetical protein AVEN_24943-1 [Araneus ventricosus]|uniref:Uncharacterized protein n=1 Tax=Araneus ventricosus TaxID=182803 RepID=A0A4Y2NZH2_ARAVE|nr:hypothetical protein AVEN_239282-1 [Araneus ventricosus]GBN44169.1 hypothetical protein AVEN_24943-1 [Araneus ventricosus]